MRRGGDSTGSLELLLDTICNMFGGIVLIFILLAVLSQFSARESHEAVENKNVPGITREVWEKQEKQIAALNKKINEILSQVGELTNKITSARLPDIGLLLEQLRIEETNRKTLTSELTNLVARLEALTNRQVSAREDKTGVVAEESDRTPVFCVLRFDRFFAIHDVSSPVHPRTHSNRQVELVARADGSILARLKRETGQIISDGCENRDVLRTALANIKADREYIEFVVYPDSYATFQYVLGVLKKKGIAYSWLPLPETEEIVMSTSALPGKRTIMK